MPCTINKHAGPASPGIVSAGYIDVDIALCILQQMVGDQVVEIGISLAGLDEVDAFHGAAMTAHHCKPSLGQRGCVMVMSASKAEAENRTHITSSVEHAICAAFGISSSPEDAPTVGWHLQIKLHAAGSKTCGFLIVQEQAQPLHIVEGSSTHLAIPAQHVITLLHVLLHGIILRQKGCLVVWLAVRLLLVVMVEVLHVAVNMRISAAAMAQRAYQIIALKQMPANIKVPEAVLQVAVLDY